jgi:hypothetical protein
LQALYAIHTGEHGPDEHQAALTRALNKAELAMDRTIPT